MREIMSQPTAADVLERYYCNDPVAVHGFLVEHQFLIPLLLKLLPDAVGLFPVRSPRLELEADPEHPGDQELVVFVGTDQEPAGARQLLKRFDSRWARVIRSEGRNKLFVDIEPVIA